ncbi:coiled-coil domain-containing protein 81-like isoform X2 [Numida meleagris]|uniref:coiled-coil domain-containing protein 81-like isoform X2 n=1 Tax=Numida meleagris TaxID=8996 RepID=UPI000B3D9614|nr:coiled-coil domain-containing protein 81-like isoform X2 [Numida meleagris]
MEMWLAVALRTFVLLADCVKVEPLNYWQLARATAFPLHVVQLCVQETILLYCLFLKDKVHVSFAFKDLGVLTCEDDFLCMTFYYNCTAMPESNARPIAALHSCLPPRLSPLANEISWIPAPAESLALFLHGLAILTRSAEVREQDPAVRRWALSRAG